MLRRSIWLPAGAVLVLASLFVGLRLHRAAHGNVKAFVVAGSDLVDARCAPRGLPVVRGPGYDGQFYYRLALDPLDLRTTSHCMRLDAPLRRGRIGFPAAAFVAAGGQERAVPWALVLVNVAGLAALAAIGGVLARDADRHVLWGLVLALYFGFLFTLGRDLGEIFEAAFVLGGLLALRKRRFVLAGMVLVVAVLAREAALFFIGAYALVRMVEMRRGRERFGIADAPWIAPAVAFAGWQLVCLASGPLPLGHSGGDSLRPPGWDFVRGLAHWSDRLHSGSGLLQIAEAA
ncbi:MAG TPA: hypothetical protein VFR41_03235, partial [Acidimicrobiia bacterium]|nr:hypothetical protein [Acidimicrobiia bacterium]